MLYTSQLAKEYLEQSKELGERNRRIENRVGLIVSQMSDSLISGNTSFTTTLDSELDDESRDYLSQAGIEAKLLDYGFKKGSIMMSIYQYRFTFREAN